MKRLSNLTTTLKRPLQVALLVFGFSSLSFAQSSIAVQSTSLRGVNIMDLSNAGDILPGIEGQHYTRPTYQSLSALKSRGVQVVRLTFSWERLQPRLSEGFNARYLELIMGTLVDANSVGMKIILDLHNFGHYVNNGNYLPLGAPGGPRPEDMADLWRRLSSVVRSNSAAYNSIYAYDLMNEPYSLPAFGGMNEYKFWEYCAQMSVNAIRALGDRKMIHVNGISFSNSRDFPRYHPAPFIQDPANNIMYQAHMYPDTRYSGEFSHSFDYEESVAIAEGYGSVAARAITRVKNFANWCKRFNQQCFLGEVGWPNAESRGWSEAQKWNKMADELFTYLDSINMGATLWATGSWLSPTDNVNNVYVLPRQGYNFQALSQASVLESHLGRFVDTSIDTFAYSTSMTNADFVRNAYRLLLGREAEAAGVTYWADSISKRSETRLNVLRAILISPEYQDRQRRKIYHPAGNTVYMSDANFVRAVYAVLLLRNADTPGLNYFVGNLTDGFSRGDFVQSIINSPEFGRL